MLPPPSKTLQQRVRPSNSYHSSQPARTSRSRRCLEVQVPIRKSKLFAMPETLGTVTDILCQQLSLRVGDFRRGRDIMPRMEILPGEGVATAKVGESREV